MTAITLQKQLIKKIASIDNVATLKSIQSLIKEEAKPRKLSEIQKKMIAIGMEEIKDGKGIPHELFMKELETKYGFV
jgi:Zn-dependent M32 family carboxypeptidase